MKHRMAILGMLFALCFMFNQGSIVEARGNQHVVHVPDLRTTTPDTPQCKDDPGCKMSTFISDWLTHNGLAGAIFSIGNSISLVALLITAATFCFFAELRSCPRGIAHLCSLLALFMAQLSLQINPYFSGLKVVCSVMAMFQHYFILALSIWLTVITYDLFKEAKQIKCGESETPHRTHPKRNFIIYSLVSWCTPILSLLANFFSVSFDGNIHYGNNQLCGVFGDHLMLYTLAIPLVLLGLINLSISLITLRLYQLSPSMCIPPRCHNEERKVDDSDGRGTNSTAGVIVPSNQQPEDLEEPRTRYNSQVRRTLANLRFSMAVTFAWISGFVTVFTQIPTLWVFFVVLNAAVGVMAFCGIVLTVDVIGFYVLAFNKLTPKRCLCRRSTKSPSLLHSEQENETNEHDTKGVSAVSDIFSKLDNKSDVVFIQ